MARPSPEKQLERLLVMVPWIMQHDGPSVDEVCARFAISESELASTLELLFLCGLYPFTPDALIEAEIVDDHVYIRSADQFNAPPRLNANEAIGLLATATAALRLDGNETNPVLQSAVNKLTSALGVQPSVTEIEVKPDLDHMLGLLQSAVSDHRTITTEYYSYGRNALGRRRLDPHAIFQADGRWYLLAFDADRAAFRTFRLDRMMNVEMTEATFVPRDDMPDEAAFSASKMFPCVRLRIALSARWVLEQYPTESVESSDDGSLEVTFRVSEPTWLHRLLLRLGDQATVLEGDHDVSSTASAILARYR